LHVRLSRVIKIILTYLLTYFIRRFYFTNSFMLNYAPVASFLVVSTIKSHYDDEDEDST